jgi:hypothetical protein
MVAACKNNFDQILSIELNGTLCKAATRRFHRFRHITIIEGDSAGVLPRILDGIDYPCLFWLDGHYSAGITGKGNIETPIRQELECILDHRAAGHVILIDDARCFTGDNDYPTIKDLQRMITGGDLDMAFEVKDDVIRIHPRRATGESWQRH